MRTAPLWSVAESRPSNVDKKSVAGEDSVRLVNYTDVYKNAAIHPDMELMEATASDDHISRFGVLPGDVIITKDSETPDDIGIPAIVEAAEPDMVCAYHLTLLRPRHGRVYPKFLYWFLESTVTKDYWFTRANGVTRCSILTGTVDALPIPDHPLPTQRAIADYLDRETGEIDAMLGKLDALAGVLATRRGEVVRGALATIERKPYLGLLVNVVSGSGFPHEFQGVTDSELPFFKVSSFAEARQGVMGSSENTVSRDTAARLGATVIPKDSILMAKIGAALLLGRYARTDRPCCIDNNMQALTPRHNTFEARFLAYAMSEVPLNLLVKPGPVPSLDVMGMKMTRVPQPPLSEQRRIADHLDEVTGRIDAMLAKVAQLRALLLERRAALITDVVTGRKEVAS